MRSRRAVIAGAAAAALAMAALAAFERPASTVGSWMGPAGVVPAFAEVDGTRVRYVRRGQGLAVVLVHGFASSLFTWKDVLPVLARDHDVIALDLPGFGGSAVPRPLDPARYPRVVWGLLDLLGVARVDVVGNSLGGALAVALAAERPDRVRRIALLDSAGFNYAAADRPLLLRALTWPGVAAVTEHLPVRRRLVSLALRQVFEDDRLVTPERIDEYAEPLRRPGIPAALGDLLSARDPFGFPGVMARVRAPALVIWGREDRWIPAAHAERFRAALGNARVAILDGCGHMPQEERPEEVVSLLAGFLAADAESARVY